MNGNLGNNSPPQPMTTHLSMSNAAGPSTTMSARRMASISHSQGGCRLGKVPPAARAAVACLAAALAAAAACGCAEAAVAAAGAAAKATLLVMLTACMLVLTSRSHSRPPVTVLWLMEQPARRTCRGDCVQQHAWQRHNES